MLIFAIFFFWNNSWTFSSAAGSYLTLFKVPVSIPRANNKENLLCSEQPAAGADATGSGRQVFGCEFYVTNLFPVLTLPL